ncbi:DUF2017 family protein [Sanguibacter antarcticus]|uniref:Uncharacterized protein DUF2017 n=1 Tax=Sanguibacter antarcticus TaxID=372484 RepID=A0A2A9E650_9MICO|nr:DUF2017 family protein [Sanguibacter antarcticus]PFG33669.1 uncharacterized protein DUF2017 [Sanguibacter antarcticus]
MVRPFETSDDEERVYVAGLSTPERLVLAQVTGDVVELLGGEEGVFGDVDVDEDGHEAEGEPTDEPTDGLRELFDGLDDEPVRPPTDPAVRRLLPDASSDPEIAREFRRFTDDDLRQTKVERLLLFAQLLLEAAPSSDEERQLEFVVLHEEAEAIAGALADIRLVIGERLDLRTDDDSQDLYDAVTATWGDPSGPEPVGATDDALDAARTSRDVDDDQVDAMLSGEEHLHPDDSAEFSGPRIFLGSVFLLAGYLQESLTDCLLRDYRASRGRR